MSTVSSGGQLNVLIVGWQFPCTPFKSTFAFLHLTFRRLLLHTTHTPEGIIFTHFTDVAGLAFG